MDSKEQELALVNCKIWTDGVVLKETAILTRNNIIEKLSSNKDVLESASPFATIIDANFKLIVPGFIDSHIHFIMGGSRLTSVQLSDCKDSQDFKDRIRLFCNKLQKGEWVCGGDWDNTKWTDPTTPITASLIDSVSPNNPIWINRTEGHQYLANSLALKLAGVTNSTPDVVGGTIHRDTDNNPTGLLADNALSLVYPFVPALNQKECDIAINAATRYLHAYGVTSIHNMTEPADRNRAGLANDLEIFQICSLG